MSLNVQLYYGINQMIQNIGFSYQCHNTGRRVLCTYTMVHKITIFKGVLQEISVMPRAGPEEVLHDTGIQRTLKVEVMLSPFMPALGIPLHVSFSWSIPIIHTDHPITD